MADRTCPTDAFTEFAVELSRNLGMIRALLAAHPDSGPCHGCMLPGATPAPAAPCSVRKLAMLALSIRLDRHDEC